MRRTLLNSKIHRATVTQADLHYVGSLTIDAELMRAADIVDADNRPIAIGADPAEPVPGAELQRTGRGA